MKKITIVIASFIIVIVVAAIALNRSTDISKNTEGITELPQAHGKEYLVNRGKYLVSIMGCNDCHSPKMIKPGQQEPEVDPARMLSGHPATVTVADVDTRYIKDWVYLNHNMTAAIGPWGISYAANITSDETGIGSWTEEQFIKCIREGKHKGMDNTRPLLPPMPWQKYAQATDEDLRAIFYYLRSTPPVNNVVPVPEPLHKVGYVERGELH